jgi:Leucine-rich repeat (LRR) protein
VIGANAFAKYDMLTKLYLQNNSIQEIKKNAFAQLTQLKHLDLSINQLKTAKPRVIVKLKRFELLRKILHR